MKKLLVKLYNIIPFKKQGFQFIKLFWTPPHSVYKHLHFTGVIKVKVDDTASFNMQHYGTEIENDFFFGKGWMVAGKKYQCNTGFNCAAKRK